MSGTSRPLRDRTVLGVAFEPWDTKLQLSLLARLKGEGCDVRLVVGDCWQVEIVNACRILKSEVNRHSIECTTVFDDIAQIRLRILLAGIFLPRFVIKKRLKNLYDDDTIERLLMSDHIFQHEERRPYYLPMSSRAKLLVLVHVTDAVNAIYDRDDLTDIVMIDRNYLVKNVVAEIARMRHVNCWVIGNARVDQTIWITRFWPDKTGEFLGDYSKINKWRHSSEAFEQENSRSEVLYAALSADHLSELRSAGSPTLLLSIREIGRALRDEIRSQKENRRHLKHAVTAIFTGVYAGSRCLLLISSVLRSFRRSQFLRGRSGYDTSYPSMPYVLIPLHARPEDSTLTLGAGLRDEDVVSLVSAHTEKLGLPFAIYALENPSAVWDGRKEILQHCSTAGVPILSPLLDTQTLIFGASAVIGVSGTAILEADVAGVPAFAAGRPEFGPLLASWGLDLEEFLRRVGRGVDGTFSFGRSRRFVAWMRACGITATFGWAAVRSEKERQSSVDAMVAALEQAHFF